MTWEKTVMSWERIRMVFQEQDKKGTTDNMFRMEALCAAQAKISYKAGIREVVKWFMDNSVVKNRGHRPWKPYLEVEVTAEEWQAKLKEWGITEVK